MSDHTPPQPGPAGPRPGPTQRYVQPYPGAAPVLVDVAPAGMRPPGAGRDPRSATLAIVGLCLAGVGVLGLPLLTVFAIPLLIAGLVCGMIVVLGGTHGGRGFGIAAIATSVGGGGVAVIGLLVWTLIFGASFGGIGEAFGFDSRSDPYDDGSQVLPPDDEGDPAPDRGDAEYGADLDLVAGEHFLRVLDGEPATWQYGVTVDNPNPDAIYELVIIEVDALDAAGTVVDTDEQYVTIQPGPSALSGMFLDAGDATITDVRVRFPDKSAARLLTPDETGSIAAEDVQVDEVGDLPVVTGVVSNTTPYDAPFAQVVVVARDTSGAVIAIEYTYVDELPAGGTQTFTLALYDPLPAGATVDAYVTL